MANSIIGNNSSFGYGRECKIIPIDIQKYTNSQPSNTDTTFIDIPLNISNAEYGRFAFAMFMVDKRNSWISTNDPSPSPGSEFNYIFPALHTPFIVTKTMSPFVIANVKDGYTNMDYIMYYTIMIHLTSSRLRFIMNGSAREKSNGQYVNNWSPCISINGLAEIYS